MEAREYEAKNFVLESKNYLISNYELTAFLFRGGLASGGRVESIETKKRARRLLSRAIRRNKQW